MELELLKDVINVRTGVLSFTPNLLKGSCEVFKKCFSSGSKQELINAIQRIIDSSSSKFQIKVRSWGSYSGDYCDRAYDVILSSAELEEQKPVIFKALREVFPYLQVTIELDYIDTEFSVQYRSKTVVLPNDNGQVHAKLTFHSAKTNSYGSAKLLRLNSIKLHFPNFVDDSVVIPSPEGRKLVATPRKILEESIASDVVIVAENGKEFPCHKNFLLDPVQYQFAVAECFEIDFLAQGDVFQSMFRSGMQESKTSRIEAPDLSENGVGALLKYLYYLDMSAVREDPEIAFELLYASRKYNLTVLESDVKAFLFWVKKTEVPVHVALKVFLFLRTDPGANALKMKMAEVIKLKFSEFEGLPCYKELFKTNAEAAMELFKCFAQIS